MDHYLEILLHPDPEFTANILMSALFSKLHRGLVNHGSQRIGLSFPDIRPDSTQGSRTLGQRVRLHGSRGNLHGLMQSGWLQGMRDHCELTGIMAVPDGAKQRVVCRVQAKSSPERLRRRLMMRKQIDEVAACESIPDSAAERLNLPFVTLSSATTSQRFKLFVEHRPIQDVAVPGIFSAYGLSNTATVPWF